MENPLGPYWRFVLLLMIGTFKHPISFKRLSQIRLQQELNFIVLMKICFLLRTVDCESILYLFPSLSSQASMNIYEIQFQCVLTVHLATIKFLQYSNPKLVTRLQFCAPQATIYV